MKYHAHIVRFLVAASVGGSLSSSALADSATAPEISFSMSVGQQSSSWKDSFGVSAGGALWAYNSSHSMEGAGVSYSLLADPDPLLSFNFGFINDTQETQLFHFVMTLPVAPHLGATKIGATVGGYVEDFDQSGHASIATLEGDPLFDGVIDGSSWMPLLSDPFEAQVNEAGGATPIGEDADGMPDPIYDGPTGVSQMISVELTFLLSPGDLANIEGSFLVVYVPAPAAAVLLLAAPAFRRRRTA